MAEAGAAALQLQAEECRGPSATPRKRGGGKAPPLRFQGGVAPPHLDRGLQTARP